MSDQLHHMSWMIQLRWLHGWTNCNLSGTILSANSGLLPPLRLHQAHQFKVCNLLISELLLDSLGHIGAHVRRENYLSLIMLGGKVKLSFQLQGAWHSERKVRVVQLSQHALRETLAAQRVNLTLQSHLMLMWGQETPGGWINLESLERIKWLSRWRLEILVSKSPTRKGMDAWVDSAPSSNAKRTPGLDDPHNRPQAFGPALSWSWYRSSRCKSAKGENPSGIISISESAPALCQHLKMHCRQEKNDASLNFEDPYDTEIFRRPIERGNMMNDAQFEKAKYLVCAIAMEKWRPRTTVCFVKLPCQVVQLLNCQIALVLYDISCSWRLILHWYCRSVVVWQEIVKEQQRKWVWMGVVSGWGEVGLSISIGIHHHH